MAVSATPTDVPRWARWTERLTTVLVATDLAALAAGAAGVPGAHAVLGVVATGSLLGTVVVLLKISPLHRRLRSTVVADRTRQRAFRAADLLRRGGVVELGERPAVGRLAWSILARNALLAWTETMATCTASAGMFDVQGRFHWAWGWPVPSSAFALLSVAVLVMTLRESARWYRIAVDPNLAEAPSTI